MPGRAPGLAPVGEDYLAFPKLLIKVHSDMYQTNGKNNLSANIKEEGANLYANPQKTATPTARSNSKEARGIRTSTRLSRKVNYTRDQLLENPQLFSSGRRIIQSSRNVSAEFFFHVSALSDARTE